MTQASDTAAPIDRASHARWLLELTQTPTAAGREQRVVAWIRRWAAERPRVHVGADAAGNLVLSLDGDNDRSGPGVYFTAHLDHPAFVVEAVRPGGEIELSFRGGVMDDYFRGGRVRLHPREGEAFAVELAGTLPGPQGAPFKRYAARDDHAARLTPGDVGVWDLPPAEIVNGELHTQACDDLAAAVAALAAFDALRSRPALPSPVRVLFTRAEEIGFVGAIAAVRHGTIARGSRVIALENSRSFPDSPIGGGPIVRVGDRLSIFTPSLTDAIARRAEDLGGAPITASQKQSDAPAWKWQRKLMPGGACEATVFCAAGFEATCLCLPLGNYHNMADLAAVQAGTNTSPPVVAREFISIADFDGLVDLLVACGERLPGAAPLAERFDRLYNERRFVLE